jgi:hypothetical protein
VLGFLFPTSFHRDFCLLITNFWHAGLGNELLTGLKTSPGGSNLVFSPSTHVYSITTGADQITVNLTVPPQAVADVNGLPSGSSIYLDSNTTSAVTINVNPSNFTCSLPVSTYTLNVLQGVSPKADFP